MQKDYLKNSNPLEANNLLKKVYYKFFYTDELGQRSGKVVEVNKEDCELAIATFEKENPDIMWTSFTGMGVTFD